jgi:hypothetical protein
MLINFTINYFKSFNCLIKLQVMFCHTVIALYASDEYLQSIVGIRREIVMKYSALSPLFRMFPVRFSPIDVQIIYDMNYFLRQIGCG